MSAEKRLVLDTVNEVGSALLDLVPWRAREGLDRLVADANQRYRQADETITQRVQLVQAAIQRSQQVQQQTLFYSNSIMALKQSFFHQCFGLEM